MSKDSPDDTNRAEALGVGASAALGSFLTPILLTALVAVGMVNANSVTDLASGLAEEIARREATDERLAEKQRDCDRLEASIRELEKHQQQQKNELFELRIFTKQRGAQGAFGREAVQ